MMLKKQIKGFFKNPWVITIGSTVIGGVLLSLVLDWIKEVDWLTTLKSVCNFVVNAIVLFLNFELKVWWVLAAIACLFATLVVYVMILDKKQKSEPIPFLNYRKDSMLGFTWEWDYKQNYDGKYTIANLHPVCSKCGMSLKQGGSYGLQMRCVRCNKTKDWKSDYLTDARLLIEDNIQKNSFPDQ